MIQFFTYNNYFNRIVKKSNTIADYGMPLHTSEAQFKEGNAIDTRVIINYDGNTIPDYALVIDNDIIVSRWFVIDCDLIRKGQYNVSLHRDVIADNLDAVKNAPCYIEKATLPKNSILNFNNENMTFNQIKTGEELLKDSTNVAWLVGYVASPQADEADQTIALNTPVEYQLSADSLEAWAYNQYVNTVTPTDVVLNNVTVRVASNYRTTLSASTYAYKGNYIKVSNAGIININSINSEMFEGYRGTASDINASGYYDTELQQRNLNSIAQEVSTLYDYSRIQNAIRDSYIPSASLKNQLLALNGKVIRIGTNDENYTYYNITVTNAETETIDVEPTMTNYVATVLKAIYDEATTFNGTADDNTFKYNFTKNGLKVTLSQIISSTNLVIKNSRPTLDDAPYCMFATPYQPTTISIDGTDHTTNNYMSMKMITKLYEKLGSKCYDIQLLPYCPMPEVLVNGKVTITSTDIRYAPINKDTDIYSFIYWCKSSSFTFNIDKEITASNEIKVQNETEFIRFNSPNYASSFDFSVAKNSGIDYINVDCTYKPYSPYIHLNPNFKGIYGADYNDARGLILSGDFSIPRVNDAWTEYQLQNKNFQASFDRSIQSMDKQNKFSLENDVYKVIAGTMAGGIGAGMTGGIGAGVAGGMLSMLGGMRDIQINQALRNDQRSLTIDQYNYNLGNIQARPDTLQKVGALNANNKIFPFIEYYSATEEEKNILRNKIKYEGMTVNTIGIINDYLTDDLQYIKGKIIRLDINDDFITTTEIYNEINQGVYISNE